MDIELFDLLAERGVEILLHAPVSGVRLEGNRVTGVEAECREGRRIFSARCVIDCTGDGDVAFRAGVPFEIGRAGDGLMQPVSIMYLIGGIDPLRRMKCTCEQDARITMVNGRTWEEIVLEAQSGGRLPDTVSVIRLYHAVREDENIVNATQVNYIDGTSSADLTRAEIEGRRQAFRILDFLRETVPGYENAFISQMPAAIGVRETRRFEGVARLEKGEHFKLPMVVLQEYASDPVNAFLTVCSFPAGSTGCCLPDAASVHRTKRWLAAGSCALRWRSVPERAQPGRMPPVAAVSCATCR